MAGTNDQLNSTPRVCAVRLPGSSQARFADAGVLQTEIDEWVVIQGIAGEEAARIVVAPDQWIRQPAITDLLSVIRSLPATELRKVEEQIQVAMRLVDPVSDVLRQISPGTYLAGLRYTLTGESLIVTLLGSTSPDSESLVSEISNVSGADVLLEEQATLGGQGMLGGGVGRILGRRANTFHELLRQRADVLQRADVFAPHGIPRLGATVRTPQGSGTLTTVDIRHRMARIQLPNGAVIELPVDELEDPGGHPERDAFE